MFTHDEWRVKEGAESLQVWRVEEGNLQRRRRGAGVCGRRCPSQGIDGGQQLLHLGGLALDLLAFGDQLNKR